MMTPDERIVRAIERLVVEAIGITTVALTEARPEVELTLPQWRVLVVVGASGDGLRVGEIAARIGSTVPTTSRLVRRVERRGLVATVRDESDRRATLVRLTADGETYRTSLVERRQQLIRTSLSEGRPLPPRLAADLERIGDALAMYG
jgi:DNA-binding MarR family transcriptional regulator